MDILLGKGGHQDTILEQRHTLQKMLFFPFLCGKHSTVGTAAFSEEPFEVKKMF
jgi:hypothetical protein